ncbi:MAG: TlpA disulfide reductase family protein [Chloroflexi bacterium]|nr:TlpA disulfide reductase family protein [Chloroflexota bacterium]
MNQRAKVAAGVAGVVLIATFLGLMGWALANQEPVTGRSGVTRLHKAAPPISLDLFDGGTLDISQDAGRPIVVNFWASWCPPCRDEARLLERTWRKYREEGVLFVGVDIQDTEAEATAYVREFDITYPNGLDRDGKISIDYGVIGLPVTFFIDGAGIVQKRWVGAIDGATLESWLGELVAGTAHQGNSEGQDLDRFFELGK